MAVSPINTSLRVVSRQTFRQNTPQKSATQFAVNLLQEFINGILVFTDQQQLIYISSSAHKILRRLQPDTPSRNQIPEEILHICQSVIQSRHHFPKQSWLTEFDIFTQDATILHIHSQWLKLEPLDNPCLVLMIEDRQQAIKNILLEEANQYDLTPREKEVWLLHRDGLTYKQIAMELGITPNTVKKHMKSIHAKQKQSTYCYCTKD
ncbi:MAG: helix-turn-helix transcriptional regulator [Cyanobacteria bacterium P01_B01_bin.77]